MDYFSYVLSTRPEDAHKPLLINADSPQHSLTWSQYTTLVERIALNLRYQNKDLFRSGGSQQNDNGSVAICSSNSIYYHILGDAVVAAGGVFVAISPTITPLEMAGITKVANIKRLFADNVNKWQNLGEEVGVWQFDAPDLFLPKEDAKSFSDLLDEVMGVSDPTAWQAKNWTIDPDSTAFRMLTSGSTGLPKAADISHAGIVNRMKSMWRNRPLNRLWNMNLCLPTARSMWADAVTHNEQWVVTNSYDGNNTIEKIVEFQSEMLTISPRITEDILEVLERDERWKGRQPLSDIKSVTIVGGAVRPETVERFRQLCAEDAQVRGIYGSTEINIITVPDVGETRPGFVGQPYPGVEVSIVDPETGTFLGSDVAGEVCIRAATVFNGYYNNPRATQECFMRDPAGGKDWFKTGDKGYLDSASGQLVLTGRFKEIFKVGNQEVAPVEVEAVLLRHPAISDAAMGPVESRQKGLVVEPRAYVVVKEGIRMEADGVFDFVRSNMSAHKAPTGGVKFVAEIPRNAGGKIVRSQLPGLKALDGSVEYCE